MIGLGPGGLLGVGQTAGAATQVPCSSIGGGKYDCQFYPAGNGYSAGAPVQSSNGATVGYLNQGTNYVFCQARGSEVSSGAYHNDWWAYTVANDGQHGWVNAVWASGGDNDQGFANVPACPAGDGLPPGGSAPPPPSTTTTTVTTRTTTTTTTTTTPAPPVTVTVPAAPVPPGLHREGHLTVVVAYRWRLDGTRTRLVWVHLHRVAAGVRVSIRCTPARRCPGTAGSLPPRVAAHRLARVYRGGTALRLAFRRTGDVTEVVGVHFRAGRKPIGRLIAH